MWLIDSEKSPMDDAIFTVVPAWSAVWRNVNLKAGKNSFISTGSFNHGSLANAIGQWLWERSFQHQ